MTVTVKHSGETVQGTPISSSSSLESFFGAVSAFPTMEEDSEEKPPTNKSQQQSVDRGDLAPSGSSVISPSFPPLLLGESTATTAALPSLLLPPQQAPAGAKPPPSPSSGSAPLSGLVAGSQAPEFLYQLTKMLTDSNRDTIEWTNGRIEVHSPHRLEAKVLHKYFRHSKFASFQRQLNYFGFRKQSGKGKMAPCSYVNENLPSNDLSCLLHIKRKTSISTSAKEKEKQSKKKDAKAAAQTGEQGSSVNPVLAGILQRSSLTDGAAAGEEDDAVKESPTLKTARLAVARAAVGRGIRHSYGGRPADPSKPLEFARRPRPESGQQEHSMPQDARGSTTAAPQNASSANSLGGKADMSNPLSQLVSNYQNSLNSMPAETAPAAQAAQPAPATVQEGYEGGFLSRDDSLVDLAMIPLADGSDAATTEDIPVIGGKQEDDEGDAFNFIDFPNPDVFPPPSQSNEERREDGI